MGFFSIFKKEEIEEENISSSGSLDINLEDVDFSKLTSQERNNYVEEQCELILECNNNVEAAKKEYKTVSAYFSDIQLIEGQPEKVRDKITYLAKVITDLDVDRKTLIGEERKISGSRFLQMKEEEDTIVEGIKNLKNNELYLQIVKKDMSALNGEKAALKLDTSELVQRQRIIKNITIVSLVCFVIIFCAIIVAGEVTENDYSTYFLIVLFLGTIFATVVILLYQRTVYNVALTEKKVNKAIALHNKVKIKYINVANLIQYQYDKYGVKSSYELADLYQRYLETKAAREKYKKATMELSDSEEELQEMLISLGLYDPKIWITQVRALCEAKEMVEIRHAYSVRRRGLRKYIEDNTERAEKAKASLRKIIEDYPGLAQEVLVIVEKYD